MLLITVAILVSSQEVELVVTPGAVPQVGITSPQSGYEVLLGDPMLIEISASDEDNNIASVEVFNNNNFVQRATTCKWSVDQSACACPIITGRSKPNSCFWPVSVILYSNKCWPS